jgi:hypothetical protein
MRRTSPIPTLIFLCATACFIFFIGCGSTSSSGGSVNVSVTPASASVGVNAQQQFTATVSGSSNTAVTWSVSGGSADGMISTTGLYTAPSSVPNPAQVTVTATSQASGSHSGSAAVTITSMTSGGGVTVSPTSATLLNFGSQQFSASIGGASTNAVNWQVNGTVGGTQQFGFISSTGLYVAPSSAPTKPDGSGGTTTNNVTITITAVSQANSSQSGNATVTITPGNQNAQSGAIAIELGTAGANTNDTTTNSTAHTITCCSGTLGSLVTRAGSFFILSNTHVLARSDASPSTGGDPIIQPAACPPNARTVANLTAFYNLQTGAAPKIDAAIAAIVPGAVDTSGNILYLGATADSSGVPVSAAPHGGSGIPATVSMAVAKSGAATGLTCSTVLATSVNTSVQYNPTCGATSGGFSVTYTNQVDVAGGSFSASGDSGSLIVSQSTADAVALLYAGSDTDTVGNPIGQVLNFFATGGNALTFGDPNTHPAHQVIGCTLPTKPASASTQAAVSVSPQSMQQAAAARDAHAPELLAHPEVQALGVSASRDNPHESAIVFFVTKGQSRSNLPAQVDGIRTRIVEADLFARRGALSAEQSAQLERSAPEPPLVYSISASEYARAQQVHAAHADEQMRQPGVQGVGITSSIDAPGEAALMIFLVRGAAHNPIPPVIDGLRTRIRESSPFHAGLRNTSTACRIAAPAPALTSILRH